MIIVSLTDPHDPQATALLKQSHALMQSLFPPEDTFYLDIDDLTADHIRFFSARKGDAIIGTGAIALNPDYAEIKSMFVAETARGTGAADAILRQLEDAARAENCTMIKLETGNVLYAAQKLYARHGFEICGPFGNYEEGHSSVFMEKPLT